MPSHLLGVMQFFGVVLGLVASCTLLPGHNRVKAPSTLSASPAVIMVATAMPELQMPTVRHGLPTQHKGGLRGRRIDGPVGVPVSLPLGAASMPPGSQRTVGLGWRRNHPWVGQSFLAEQLGMTLTSRLRTPQTGPLISTGEVLPLSFSSPSLQSKF